ncbi:hypothetical protein [Burkholderia ubonensis]|uniref:HalD/BesD family halogenase n=1 Tax=Burkholderia ubonensis TaxID=101571 RepID=UPI0007541121|nr:hypothetical protein [Burkholderia ubonensis]KVG73043.1 hypothetical protein WJ34_17935 [Burkholderia ubonensis]KVH23935.1 hypothetical protein WJ37_11005 [Burkholderia ubonensis]KVH45602.1 hypothetical protein WJ38_23310 [Burkholderia ubonensis]KVH81623.1 hypothetical protein WJ43_28295 [Burkholderia ubonensis]KVM38194.1 hypothetical protein WJ55_08220 [Burkholderia ubonensis]
MLVNNQSEEFSEVKARLTEYDISSLGDVLRSHGVVQLPGFLPTALGQAMTGEANELLRLYGRRVNVNVKSTGNTPRKYVSVSRNDVFAHAPLISQFYSVPELTQFLTALTGSDVITAPYEPEQIVVNQMNEVGDTHGWHWDDYSYSLVLMLEAPTRKSGGQVEFVDGTSWDKKSAKVQHYLDTMTVQSLDLVAGSAYLLLGKRVMHRVSPLEVEDMRKIICFTFAKEEERLVAMDHGSMEAIYG